MSSGIGWMADIEKLHFSLRTCDPGELMFEDAAVKELVYGLRASTLRGETGAVLAS